MKLQESLAANQPQGSPGEGHLVCWCKDGEMAELDAAAGLAATASIAWRSTIRCRAALDAGIWI